GPRLPRPALRHGGRRPAQRGLIAGLAAPFRPRPRRRRALQVRGYGVQWMAREWVALMGFERRIGKWDSLDPDLKILAQMAAASSIECSWCLDFGYFLAHQKGMDLAKLEAV